MSSKRKYKQRCADCGAGLHNNKHTQCWRCRCKDRCPICGQQVGNKSEGSWCASCQALPLVIHALLDAPVPEGEPAAVRRGRLAVGVRAKVRALTGNGDAGGE